MDMKKFEKGKFICMTCSYIYELDEMKREKGHEINDHPHLLKPSICIGCWEIENESKEEVAG